MRRTALAGLLCLSLALVSGCGSDDDGSSTGGTAEAGTTEAAAADGTLFETLASEVPTPTGPRGDEEVVPEVEITPEEAEKLKELAAGDRLTFAYSVHDASLDFWRDVTDGFETAIKEYVPNAEVVVADAELKPDKQLNDLESLLARDVDVGVVAPVDEAAATPGLRAWNKAGVPLVIYHAVDESIDTDGMCGTDNYQGGWLTGAYLADYLGGEGDVGSVDFEYKLWHTDQRSKGFKDAATKGGLNVAETGQALDQESGEATFESMLTANPDLKGGFAVWDGVGLGMTQAVSNLGLDDSVAVVTHDLTTASANAVRDNTVLKAAAVHFPKRIGENCAHLALKKLAGTDTSKIAALAAEELATKENVEEQHQGLYGKSIDDAL